LHVSFVVSSAFARTYALGPLSMLSDLTVILKIVSACNEVLNLTILFVLEIMHPSLKLGRPYDFVPLCCVWTTLTLSGLGALQLVSEQRL
jgi:hypothetical protein